MLNKSLDKVTLLSEVKTHLVALSDGSIVEAEEVNELVQEATNADGGDVHRAA